MTRAAIVGYLRDAGKEVAKMRHLQLLLVIAKQSAGAKEMASSRNARETRAVEEIASTGAKKDAIARASFPLQT